MYWILKAIINITGRSCESQAHSFPYDYASIHIAGAASSVYADYVKQTT
jgi:hypothetical protein